MCFFFHHSLFSHVSGGSTHRNHGVICVAALQFWPTQGLDDGRAVIGAGPLSQDIFKATNGGWSQATNNHPTLGDETGHNYTSEIFSVCRRKI